MKIAVWHNLPSGGGKRSLYYHVKGLIERGHTVESWCPSTADRTYLPLDDLITEHIIPFNWEPRAAKTFVGKALNNFYDINGEKTNFLLNKLTMTKTFTQILQKSSATSAVPILKNLIKS